MSTKKFGCLGFALALILAVSLFLNFVLVIASSRKIASGDLRRTEVPRWEEALLEKASGESRDKIASAQALTASSEKPWWTM
jgi:hypothetical protein